MKRLHILWGLLLFLSPCFGQLSYEQVPDRPRPAQAVVDWTNTLTVRERTKLADTLTGYFRRSGNQLVVVIVPTVRPNALSDYALTIGRKWGIGNQGFKKGLVLVWAKADRNVFIATGQGVEGALPDALCKRVLQSTILPAFAKDQYAMGLQAGCLQLMKLLDQAGHEERTYPSHRDNPITDGVAVSWVVLIVFLVLLLYVALLTIQAENKKAKALNDQYNRDYQDYLIRRDTLKQDSVPRPRVSSSPPAATPFRTSTINDQPSTTPGGFLADRGLGSETAAVPSNPEPDRFSYGDPSDDTFAGGGSEGRY